jgi:uncharacterized protein YbjT (DUF2867 family)
MRAFVAGASGAIGRRLIAELVRQGHTVTGMTRSRAGARRLRDLGASVAWLPAFARWVGAPPPPQITEQDALQTVSADAMYYGTKLRGASNEKAKRLFDFRPHRLQWLTQ